jgi:hypothetical protein
MKYAAILLVLVLTFICSLPAQFKAGNVEMNILGCIGSYTMSYAYTSTYTSNSNSTSRNYLVFSFSPAAIEFFNCKVRIDLCELSV